MEEVSGWIQICMWDNFILGSFDIYIFKLHGISTEPILHIFNVTEQQIVLQRGFSVQITLDKLFLRSYLNAVNLIKVTKYFNKTTVKKEQAFVSKSKIWEPKYKLKEMWKYSKTSLIHVWLKY